MKQIVSIQLAVCGFAITGVLHAGLVFTAATSPSAAGLQPTVDAFRTLIGGGTVAGPNGSFGGIRREINWDGVPDSFADPSLMPATFFVNTSPRGLGLASAPGAGVTGFEVSAKAASGNPTLFESFDGPSGGNGTYDFAAFSQERIFTPVGGHVFDIVMFEPGTGFANPSFVKAFGIVFVDNVSSTFPQCASIQAFNGATSLGFRCANPTTVGGFSFLGVEATGADVITSLRINLGNATIGTPQGNSETGFNEVVVVDDFIYSEPGRATLGDPASAPEPSTTYALAGGLLTLVGLIKRRRGTAGRKSTR